MTQTHFSSSLSLLPSRTLSSTRSVPSIRNVALLVACASLALACSREYPLGDVSQKDLAIGDGASSRKVAGNVGDATVSPLLAAPDVTFGLNDSMFDLTSNAITTVGDLDGDGLPEIAVFNFDFDTGVSYVQLRYGVPRPTSAAEAFAFGQSGAYLIEDGVSFSSGTVLPAGDVNGDGYDDLLIDTGHCTATQPWEGTFLIYGGPERLQGTRLLSEAGVTFVPPREVGLETGYACGGNNLANFASGDFDGDGFSDLVFVNPSSTGGSINGQPIPDDLDQAGIYLFYGRSERFQTGTPWSDADAHLTTSKNVMAASVGDANGDGLADLIVGSSIFAPEANATLWVPGSHQRWSGTVDLAAHATELAGGLPYAVYSTAKLGDLDGDGLADVLLLTSDFAAHLFYGAPDLFQNGVDLGAAAATFPVDPRTGLGEIVPAGDRDADGDAELMVLFSVPGPGFTGQQPDVAVLSGQRQRLSGDVSFPIDAVLAATQGPRFEADTQRYVVKVLPAGDLDGDGAADLFTVSEEYNPVGDGSTNFSPSAPQLHIHYGVPAAAAAGAAPR